MSSIWDWSYTAASNNNSDSLIIWSDSQAPSTVDDSGRAMMQRGAEMRGDLAGTTTLGGSANAITVTSRSPFTAYANGVFVGFKPTADNTGATTLNVNAIGAKSVRKMTINGDAPLTGGELKLTASILSITRLPLMVRRGWLLLNPTQSGAFATTQSWGKGADIASASTLTLGTDGNYFDVTGTTTITAISSAQAGTLIVLQFDAALQLTHHSTNLVLQGSSNITTTAGDIAVFVSDGSGRWRCVNYQTATSNVPVITSWTAYTPTFTGFGTVSGVDCYWRRVGDTLELDIRFVCGTSTATQARMSLPSGLTSVAGPNDRIAGYGFITVASAGVWTVIIEQTQTYVTFGIQNASNGGLSKLNGSAVLSSGNLASFRAAVRIAGW